MTLVPAGVTCENGGMSEGASSRTWLFFAGAAIVIATLLVIAFSREPVALDPNTPEGTVQNYLQAISDEDYDGAFNLIDPEWTEGCTPADLAASAPFQGFAASISETDEEGSRAFVTVTIREGVSTGPFGGVPGYPEFFELEKGSGQWLIIGYPWPYFEWRCEGP